MPKRPYFASQLPLSVTPGYTYTTTYTTNTYTTATNTTNGTFYGRWWNQIEPSPPRPSSEAVKKQIEDAKLSPHAALVGYRAWEVDFDNLEGPMLKSVVTGTIWPYRKELRAHRLRNDWDTPNGIHAARSMEHLMDNAYLATSKVCGEVYLWGRVIHGEVGYRAEYAYPKVLRFRHDYWWLKELANRYGIPYEVA